MKVLFTTPILEYPAAGGPEIRIENCIKGLGRVCELEVVYRCRSAAPPDSTIRFYRSLCRQFTCYLSPFSNRYLRYVNRLLRLNSYQEARYLLQRVDASGVKIVWFGFGNISFPLMRRIRHLRPELKLVCDTDSVWSRFVLRGQPYSNGFRRVRVQVSGKLKTREERRFADVCDVVTAVSEVDADYYRSIARQPDRVWRFQNVIDPESYREVPPPAQLFDRPALFLAGTFGRGSPMENAGRWVIDEILPRVRRQFPGAHFYIVGKGADQVLAGFSNPNISIAGKVPSILPYLCHMDVALVPLKFESGTRFKILEAAACGVPIVSTSLGAEGIPLIDGQHLLLADTAEAFAGAVVRLLSEREFAKRMAENARHFILAYYSVDALAAEARSILGRLQPFGRVDAQKTQSVRVNHDPCKRTAVERQ